MAKKKVEESEQFSAMRQRTQADPDAAWQQAAASPLVQQKRAPAPRPAAEPDVQPGPALPIEERTGIPLIDWLYANIDQQEPLTPPQAAGDLAMLRHFQANPAEFYSKVLTAILRKHGGDGGDGGMNGDGKEKEASELNAQLEESSSVTARDLRRRIFGDGPPCPTSRGGEALDKKAQQHGVSRDELWANPEKYGYGSTDELWQ